MKGLIKKILNEGDFDWVYDVEPTATLKDLVDSENFYLHKNFIVGGTYESSIFGSLMFDNILMKYLESYGYDGRIILTFKVLDKKSFKNSSLGRYILSDNDYFNFSHDNDSINLKLQID